MQMTPNPKERNTPRKAGPVVNSRVPLLLSYFKDLAENEDTRSLLLSYFKDLAENEDKRSLFSYDPSNYAYMLYCLFIPFEF